MLFKLSDKLGVAYYVSSALATYSSHGFWAVRGGIDNNA